VLKQDAALAGIFARNNIYRAQRFQRAQRNIAQVADRSSDDV